MKSLKNLNSNNNGFTLVELLVVVAIVGVLALIAIPTFLAQQDKAKDADAKSAIRNAAVSAASLRGSSSGWTESSVSSSSKLAKELRDDQKAFTFIPGSNPESNAPNQVNVVLSPDHSSLSLVSRTKSDNGFICAHVASTGDIAWSKAVTIADCATNTGGPAGDTPDQVDVSLRDFSSSPVKVNKPVFKVDDVESGNTAHCSVDGGAFTAATGATPTQYYTPTSVIGVGDHSLVCNQTNTANTTGANTTFNFSIANLPLCTSTWSNAANNGEEFLVGKVISKLSSDGANLNNILNYTTSTLSTAVAGDFTSANCLTSGISATACNNGNNNAALNVNEFCILVPTPPVTTSGSITTTVGYRTGPNHVITVTLRRAYTTPGGVRTYGASTKGVSCLGNPGASSYSNINLNVARNWGVYNDADVQKPGNSFNCTTPFGS